MEKEFIQIQIALFFQSDFQGAVESVSLKIKEEFGSDITPQILGIPQNAPPEIPRLIVNTNVVNINFSKNRVDFFSKEKLFLTENRKKLFNIIDSLSVRIGRVGVVITYFEEADIEYLKAVFDKGKIASLNPKEITVRFNEETSLQGMKTNNSQMFIYGSAMNQGGVAKKGIIVTRDINTPIEDINKNIFTNDVLTSFVTDAIALAEKSII